ncbi:MAG TPA: hypothetical protein DD735_07040 [Clostridiales bacterium]|nr:hypothetical protein [Clostridiales bacterium]
MISPARVILYSGDEMNKNHKQKRPEDLRVDPEARLCPKFDATGIAMFRAQEQDEMGVRVLDDCAEEHIM